MFKKSFLVSLIGITSTFAYSGLKKNAFTGAYVGFGVGFSQLNLERTESFRSLDNSYEEKSFSTGKSAVSKKTLLSLHSGYDHHFQNNWLLGAELSFDYHFHTDSFNTESYDSNVLGTHVHSSTVKNNFNAKLLFKAGKVVGRHLFYGTMGPVLGKYDIENLNNMVRGNQSYNFSKKKSLYRISYAVGAGYTYRLNKRCRVGFVALYQPR